MRCLYCHPKKGILAQSFCPTAPEHSSVFATRQQKCSDFAFVHRRGAVAGNSSICSEEFMGCLGTMEFISEGVHVDNESSPLLTRCECWGQEEDLRPIVLAKGSYLR